MTFFDLLKKFLLYTLKEIYSFFLKISLFILFISIIFIGSFSLYYNKNEKNLLKKDYSYVLFNVKDLQEDKYLENTLFTRLSESERYNVNFFEILSALNNIMENDKIEGIILNLDEISLSSTHREEFIEKFKNMKENGKKIFAISSYMDNSNYELASIADEVILFPTHSSGFSLTGYHYSNLYFKELFDKLGITMEVVRIGNYKSFGENYNSMTISDGLREEMTRILDNRFNNFTENISKNRNLVKNELESDILNGKLTNLSPFVARDKKFVDRLEYLEDFYERNSINKDEIVDIYDYYIANKSVIDRNLEIADSDGTIAIIYAEGNIVYFSENDYNNSIQIDPDTMLSKLEKLKDIEDLKGVVLRVNSPGGSALASEMIYQMLSKLNVPIYVSMGSTAASGGYYISMAGDKVFSNTSTITGSIGVVAMYPKFYNAQSKFGIKSNSISKGKYSEIYDSFTPLTEEAKEKIRESMSNTYIEFKSRVSQNRKIDMEKLEEYAQGRIWLGKEALEISLVDKNMTLEKTVEELAKDLKLEEYEIRNIYIENNILDSFKSLGSYVMKDKNIFFGLKLNNFNGEMPITNEVNFIKNHINKPLYYLPNSFMY